MHGFLIRANQFVDDKRKTNFRDSWVSVGLEHKEKKGNF